MPSQPAAPPEADLLPVDHDPFNPSDPGTLSSHDNLVPVEHDPFAPQNSAEVSAEPVMFRPLDPMNSFYSDPGGHQAIRDRAAPGGDEALRPAINPKRGTEEVGHLKGAEPYPGMISPVQPTAVKRVLDPDATYIPVTRSQLQKDPENYEHSIRLMSTYPGMPPGLASKPTDVAASAIHNHIVDNLLAIHDAQPPDVRAGSKLWYDGANKIAVDNATKYGTSVAQTAGANAALSPQKDWYMNVSLGSRVMDAMTGATGQLDRGMLATANRLMADKPADLAIARSMFGKTLGDLQTPKERAMWVRLHDETNNPREYSIINPDGSPGRIATNQDGSPSKVAWGSYAQIGNAIDAFRGQDMKTISDAMGDRHKVRSFYNNQMHPNSDLGDVTMDTHAVAAGLMRPLSGGSTEVIHNLASGGPKGSINARSSAVTGINGTYPIFADAYRDAASQRGILPREMQSITWEGIRGLFRPTYKAKASNTDAVDQMWKAHSAGQAPAAAVRKAIEEHAGGYSLPSWYTQ